MASDHHIVGWENGRSCRGHPRKKVPRNAGVLLRYTVISLLSCRTQGDKKPRGVEEERDRETLSSRSEEDNSLTGQTFSPTSPFSAGDHSGARRGKSLSVQAWTLSRARREPLETREAAHRLDDEGPCVVLFFFSLEVGLACSGAIDTPCTSRLEGTGMFLQLLLGVSLYSSVDVRISCVGRYTHIRVYTYRHICTRMHAYTSKYMDTHVYPCLYTSEPGDTETPRIL